MAADDFGGSFVYLVGGLQHTLELVIFKFTNLFGKMTPNDFGRDSTSGPLRGLDVWLQSSLRHLCL